MGLVLCLGLCVPAGSVEAQTRPSAGAPNSIVVGSTPAVSSGAYVGAENCRSCHKPEFREFNKTVHSQLKPAQEGQVMGCEACHGPGKAHADAEQAAHGDDAATAAANKLIFGFRGTGRENWERCRRATAAITSRVSLPDLRTQNTAWVAMGVMPHTWWKRRATRTTIRWTVRRRYFSQCRN